MRITFRHALMGAATLLVAAGLAGGLWWTTPGPTPPAVPEAAEEVLPLPPEPPRVADSAEYEACLGQLRNDAQGALSFAETWEARGGADGARHCSALALLGLGEPERAAARLEALAARATAAPAARAALFGQAGQAWMVAGQPVRAYGAFTMALALAPNDAELLVDRAVAAGTLGRFSDSLADTDRAVAQDARRAEAWIYRAAALRHLDRAQEALQDIERALAIEPGSPEALLERGILRQLQGDTAGARRDWEAVIANSPDSPAADLAEQNLALNAAGPARR
ncbi:tetratricopeptide repeat protein [Roseomonas sp. SSH11]|uniref:Tetratricopeptide repeat protein n=1 Tax=Pararoseomonas baculiformis TaxID=2820812 RepID=A0ABS4AJ59_9PROT|nr:tetratricopeptide repeat protein [Pararoseomonas baculiformis]MBP0446259.1 tetratricopeptide repeat protein [Pararoseomonas baculiformis]